MMCEIHCEALLQHIGHTRARKFFNSYTASSYDFVVKLTTFGQDAFWKRKILSGVRTQNKGQQILDLACGTGILAGMLNKYTKNKVTGLDFTFEYLEVTHKKMSIASVQATAEAIPYKERAFDAIVSSYLAKYVDMHAVVSECSRILAPGGTVAFHDFTCPKNPAMRTLWKFYFMILRVAGVFARSWKEVFCDLDKVICESRWTDELTQALQDKGFIEIQSNHYTFGTACIVVAKKPWKRAE